MRSYLAPDDSDQKESIHYRYVLTHIKRIVGENKFDFCIAIVMLTVGSVCSLFLPVILKHIIDVDLKSGVLFHLYKSSALFITLFLISVFLSYFQTMHLSRLGLRIITTIKTNTFANILNQSILFFDYFTPGRLLARIESDGENLKQLFSNVAINFAKNIFTLVGIFTILFYNNYFISSRIVLVIPFIILVTIFFLKRISKLYQSSRRMYADILSYITEYIQGVSTLQMYNQAEFVTAKMHEKNYEKSKVDGKANMMEWGFWGGVVLYSEIIALALIIYLGGDQVYRGVMTIGTFIMFIEFTRRMFAPILEFSEYLNIIQRSFVSAERIFKLLDTKPEITDPSNPRTLNSLNNLIELKDIYFAYSHQGENGSVKKHVLKNVSLRFPKGKMTAIIGPSGAGKSTIINLLMRFFDPERGAVLFDGLDIRDSKLSDLRSKIGLVLQDVYLFPGTIYDNIKALNKVIPDQRVEEVARLIQATSFIEKRPDSYNTLISEKGGNISFGERQLLAFARALSNNPEILVLDEATSSVDSHTEVLLQEAIRKVTKDRTSIVVAHRLSTIKQADHIYVLENGEISEEGSHELLMDKQGSYFRMYQKQDVGI